MRDSLASGLRDFRHQFLDLCLRLDAIEEINRIRHDSIAHRIEFIRRSFSLEKSLSALEADHRHSA